MSTLTRCFRYTTQIFTRSVYNGYIKALPSCRYQSTQSDTKSEAQIMEETLEDELKKMEPRILRRKPAISPFLKDAFGGKINTNILAFPEFLNKAEFESLTNHTDNLSKYIINNSDEDIVNYLKRTGIFGAPVSAMQGGIAAIMTERCRIIETLGSKYNIAMETLEQWCGIDCIINGLVGEEKEDTLSKLASGEYLISTVTVEPEASYPGMPDIRCKAKSSLNSQWVLDGEKIFKKTDLKNRYLIVLAAVTSEVAEPFLVLPNEGNITYENQIIKMKNANAKVLGRNFGEFDKTKITYKILQDALNNKRLGIASVCLGLLKHTVSEAVKCTRGKYINGLSMSELPLFQDKLAVAALKAYSIESMIYMTCGLYDNYEDPDIDIEAILCKTYASENTLKVISEILSGMEPHTISPELHKCMETAIKLSTTDEVNDKLNIFAMLSGLQYSSQTLEKEIIKRRDVLHFPMFSIKKLFENRNKDAEQSDLKLYLEEYFHPTLKVGAEYMEYGIMRLKYLNELLLIRHGTEILFEHRSLLRLSNVVANLFASIASLSRASRSYCIGLYMSEFEINVATHIATFNRIEIKEVSTDIDNDIYINGDATKLDMGEKIFKHGTTCFEHSLEKVFF